MGDSPQKLKTLDVRPRDDEIIKPNELVHIIETKPLTLDARRIYNLLIANAWDKIEEPVVHSIRKSELRGLHTSNDRLIDAIRSLMGTIVETEVERDGKKFVRRVQLLTDNEEELDERGVLNYSFSAGLRSIFKSSFVFAALQRKVMFAFTSRYALVLYEMIQARGRLKYKWSEEFELERFRRLMGVAPDKLVQFKHFNARVLVPAVTEVTGLSDYNVKITPVKNGKKVVGVTLQWGAKSEEEIKAAFKELRGSRVGRLAFGALNGAGGNNRRRRATATRNQACADYRTLAGAGKADRTRPGTGHESESQTYVCGARCRSRLWAFQQRNLDRNPPGAEEP